MKILHSLRVTCAFLFTLSLSVSTAFAGGMTYVVSPEYGKPLKEIVAKANLDDVSPYLVESNFPVEKSGPVTVAIELVSLDVGEALVNSLDARVTIERMGYRGATSTELLALATKYPQLFSGKTVVASGTVYGVPNTAHKAVVALRGFRAGNVMVRVADVCGAGVTCFQNAKVVFAVVKK